MIPHAMSKCWQVFFFTWICKEIDLWSLSSQCTNENFAKMTIAS